MTANPWRVLAEHHPHVAVIRWPIPELGRYYHRLKTIVVRENLRIVEERAVLWHEIVHLERGDEHCDRRTERNRIEREAARRAIDIEELADALLWSDQPSEVADQLKVTEDLLQLRLRHLHPSERGYLRRRQSMKEQSA